MAITGSMKVVFKFNSNLAGAGEVWALKGVTDFGIARTNAIALAKARLAMCGQGVRLLSVRLALAGVRRQSRAILHTEAPPPWTNPPAATTLGQESELSDDCVLLAGLGEANETKHVFLTGAPDTLFSETSADGLRVDVNGAFMTAYAAWRGLLLNLPGATGAAPWGFIARTPEATNAYDPIRAAGLEVSTGFVLVELAGDKTARYPIGTKVQVAGNRRESAVFRGINGTKIVSNVAFFATPNMTQVTLKNTADVDVSHFLPEALGRIRPADFYVSLLKDLSIVRASTRKRFGPFSGRRGRARTRRLLP